ncbi:hypothetical protein [Anaerocolumna jejuensis]|uniref:hypothetical protein n=1 Tax=Anaerocolumna jejuensis TaxID=259063 RepID=UPI003F7B7426
MPHGLACAYCLPYVMEYVAPAMPQKIRKIIEIFGEDSSCVEKNLLGGKVKELLLDFNKSIGIEVDRTLVKDISLAEIEVEMFQAFAPRHMGKMEALEILEKIFS